MSTQFTLSNLPATERLLVLCATTRLAQSLQQGFGNRMVDEGKSRWHALDAMTLDQWFSALEEEILLRDAAASDRFSRRVLNNFQAQLLFELAITEDLQDSVDIFDISALAANALEAHQIATLWNIALDDVFASEEQRKFVKWRRRFLALCEAKACIDAATHTQHLLAQLDSGAPRLKLPDWVVFAGFDRFTPVETALKSILATRGVSLGELQEAVQPDSVRVLSLPDTRAEIHAAAVWAAQCLQSHPKARIGIVVPNLSALRNTIQDTFDRTLAPAAYRTSLAELPRPYNISLGIPLTEYPIVGAAFELLGLMLKQNKAEQADISRLLRSPFWSAGVSELDLRCRLEAGLREGASPKAGLGSYLAFFRSELARQKLTAEQLCRHGHALEQSGPEFDQRRTPSAWAARFKERLGAAGWLAEYALSSHEYQTRQAFLETLHSLGELDAVTGQISSVQAIGYFRQLCAQRVFQAQTRGVPRIQILGILEASGLKFDCLWVMGMNDHVWPPAARPNPLLPAERQRELGTPNASAAVQLSFAKQVQQRLSCSASQIIFSCSRTESGSELRPSSLLGGLAVEKSEGEIDSSWIAQAANAQGEALAEPLDDAMAPPVGPGEHVRGGTGLLRAQAICPAWAYYQYRLGAAPLKKVSEGLDAAARGSLVHDALEFFWKTVGDSAKLQSMSAEERASTVAKAVDQALVRLDGKPGQDALKPNFRALERQRVIKLLSGWLGLELRRQPFTVIDNERMVSLEIHGIAVNLRIDRIDRLNDGRLLVIDYKTGASIDTKNWAAERITEPQLPIYAAIATPDEESVAGVVFAKVLMHEPGFSGLAEEADLLPKLMGLDSTTGRKRFPADRFPDWEALLQQWKQRIEAIAREVGSGDASVRFADEQELRYCDVSPLLRIAERQAQLERLLTPGSLT